MDQGEVIKKISRYKYLVSEYFDLDMVILFGSYVKGNAKEDSDIDVAVVVNSVSSEYFTYTPLLWKLRREIDDRIEPVLFEKGKDESGFLQEIMKTGVIID